MGSKERAIEQAREANRKVEAQKVAITVNPKTVRVIHESKQQAKSVKPKG